MAVVAYTGYASSNGSVQIDIIDASIAALDFWKKYIYSRRPVIIRGGLTDEKFEHAHWAPSALDAAAGTAQVYIESRDAASKTFGTGKKALMPLSAFLRARGNASLYLTTQPLPEDDQGIPTAVYGEPLRHMEGMFPHKPSFMGNLVLSSINLWMGRSMSPPSGPSSALQIGQSSNLHHDFHDNLYCLLRGKKIFTIAPPVEALSMYTHGSIVRVHHNGLINYSSTGMTRADGLPLDVLPPLASAGSSQTGKRRRQEQQLLKEVEEDFDEAADEVEDMWTSTAGKGQGSGGKGKGKVHGLGKRQRTKEGAGSGSASKRSKGGLKDEDSDAFWAWAEGLTGSTSAADMSRSAEDDFDLQDSDDEEQAQRGPPDHFSKVPLPSLRSIALRSCPTSASLPLALETVQCLPDVKKRFPRFATAAMTSFELLPGDMLYLPAGWFHEVVSVGGSGVPAAGSGGSSSTLARSRSSKQEAQAAMAELDSDPDLHAALNWWFYPPSNTVGQPQSSSARSPSLHSGAGMKAAASKGPQVHMMESFKAPYADDRALQLYKRALQAHKPASKAASAKASR